ncbi:MAG: hypothetical protein WD971_12815 [Pirellulales bacterium]
MVIVPYWCLALIAGTLATLLWRKFPRYSLRGMLVVATLFAVVLGLAAWARQQDDSQQHNVPPAPGNGWPTINNKSFMYLNDLSASSDAGASWTQRRMSSRHFAADWISRRDESGHNRRAMSR